MAGWPYLELTAVLPRYIPPRVPGFSVKWIACVPCGERVEYGNEEAFLVEHGPHIREFLETHRVIRPVWRPAW